MKVSGQLEEQWHKYYTCKSGALLFENFEVCGDFLCVLVLDFSSELIHRSSPMTNLRLCVTQRETTNHP